MAENTAFFSIKVDGADKLEANLTRLTKRGNELKNTKKQLTTELKGLDKASKTYTADSIALNNALAKTNIELKENNTALNKNQKEYIESSQAIKTAEGSIVQLRAQLKRETTAYDRLSASQRNNTNIGVKQKARINELTNALKKQEEATGRNQRSVGNYGQAVNGLLPIMGGFGSQLSFMIGQLATIKASLMGVSAGQNAVAVSTSLTSKALRGFKIALIATGIGAIVVLLGTLVAAFTSTQAGMDKVTKVTRPLGVILGRLFGVIQDVGLSVIEGLGNAISNPTEAFKSMVDTFTSGFQFLKDVVINPYISTFKILALTVQQNILKMRIAWNELTGDSSESLELNKRLEEVNGKIKENVAIIKNGATVTKNAITSLSDATGRAIDGMNEAIKLGERIDALTKKIEIQEINNLTIQAKLRVEREKQLTISKDQTKTDEERLEALRKGENAQNQLLKSREDILKQRINLKKEEQSINDTSREELKELAQLEADLILLQAENEKKRSAIVSQRSAIEIKAINKKKAEEKKANDEILKSDQKLKEERISANKDLDAEILSLEQQALINSITNKEDAEKKKLEIERDARIKGIEESVADEKKKKEAIKLVNDEFNAVQKALNDEKALKEEEVEKNNRDAIKSQAIASAQQVASTVLDVFKNRTERQKEIALANLDAQLQNGLISQTQFEEKKLAIEKKAFQKKKQQDIASAVINGAVAVTKALATSGLVGLLQAGAIATATAGQIGIIASQKFARGGVLEGNSHENGGIPFTINGQSGFEAEGGETLINKESSRRFAPLLSAINQAGGGVALSSPNTSSLSKFRNGGILNNNVSLDNNGLSEEIQKGVVNAIQSIKIVNVAEETTTESNRVKQIENINTF